MLTIPNNAAQASGNADHPPPARRSSQPQLAGNHSIYSNEESNTSFSSHALSSDQLLASTLYGMRSDSPLERPGNPAPRSHDISYPHLMSLQIPRSTSTYLNERVVRSVSRQRSLTKPERQRPRPSMVTGIPTALSIDQLANEAASSSSLSSPSEINHRRAITSNSGKLRIPQGAIDQGALLQNQNGFSFARFSWWIILSRLATCCFPGWCLRICLKKQSKMVQQAWREKVKDFAKIYGSA